MFQVSKFLIIKYYFLYILNFSHFKNQRNKFKPIKINFKQLITQTKVSSSNTKSYNLDIQIYNDRGENRKFQLAPTQPANTLLSLVFHINRPPSICPIPHSFISCNNTSVLQQNMANLHSKNLYLYAIILYMILLQTSKNGCIITINAQNSPSSSNTPRLTSLFPHLSFNNDFSQIFGDSNVQIYGNGSFANISLDKKTGRLNYYILEE